MAPVKSDTQEIGRAVIERVSPQINCGRFPIKRVVGEQVAVEADIFADGQEKLSAVIRYRKLPAGRWIERSMESEINDVWRGSFDVDAIGGYEFSVEAWIDRFGSWKELLQKRIAARQELQSELLAGAVLAREAAARASGGDAQRLNLLAASLEGSDSETARSGVALSDELDDLMARYPDRRNSTHYDKALPVWVDRPKARFSAWYEMFPRSASPTPDRHGTFLDVIERLPYLKNLGIDVLYFPPIHPIGTTHRKGKNNRLVAEAGDCGSPWGIGSSEGGHKAIHSRLGTTADFQKLIEAAAEVEIEIALDIAIQCSPDHPYVREHPEWFSKKPDGSIRYAENPPKKYQDIYPLNFECEDWRSLWNEMKTIFDYWIDQGIRIFRVDNPHTKPFAFWEWLISSIHKEHPDILFLAEAFTRPKVMHRLAKAGFTQSYTYFTWRNDKWELEQYLKDLSQGEGREYFRPNLWPNTPDILHESLQKGGKPAFIGRLTLAATAGASYGIYGPSFELCRNIPREPDSEEYIDSEKYEIRYWDLDDPGSLAPLISRINRARRENRALHSDWSLKLHTIDNPFLLAYSKATSERDNIVLIIVNLDFGSTQIGWVDIPLQDWKIGWDESFQVHDVLTDERYIWRGPRNYIELNPRKSPAHIFVVERLTEE